MSAKEDVSELAGPGRYAIEKSIQWGRHKSESPAVFSKANRVVDVRKWGYKLQN
jgi:hypothetical protein